jgi:predicted RNase H-like HicB family nuclease
MNNFVIHALWDEEAQVWVAESTDVPGLCTEASTLELLSQKIQIMIPELLEPMPKNATILARVS